MWSYRLNRFLKVHLSNKGKYERIGLGKYGQQKKHFVHRLVAETFIPNPECKEQVDHIDSDTFNNHMSNLRWVTANENMHNLKSANGYCWDKHAQKWKAYIRLNNKLIHLGVYNTEEEARQTYLDAKKIYHPTSPINK